MKVGIVTITEGENYGNRLQNYATQSVLTKLGCKSETLFNNYGYKKNGVKEMVKGIMYLVARKLNIKDNYKINNIERFKKFKKLNDKLI